MTTFVAGAFLEFLSRKLGYRPRFTHREGIPPTLAWYREHGQLPEDVAAAGLDTLPGD